MIKNYFNKLLFILFLIFIVSIIALTSIFKLTNIDKPIGFLKIKKANQVLRLDELRYNNDLKYIGFFSFDCPTCNALLKNKLLNKNIFFVNVDFNKTIPINIWQLLPNEQIEIYYVPYIVKVDSSFRIIEEYKISEIEKRLKDGNLL